MTDAEKEYAIRQIRNASIEKIIDYLWDDERKHFEEVTNFEPYDEEHLIISIHNALVTGDWSEFPDGEDHIFTYLTAIAFWDRLEEQLWED